MTYSRVLDSLAHRCVRWSAVRANASLGAAAGLHTVSDLLRFGRACGLFARPSAATRGTSGPSVEVDEAWAASVRPRRYAGPFSQVSHSTRWRALSSEFPCASMNSPALSGRLLYRVVDHKKIINFLYHDLDFWERDVVKDLDIKRLQHPFELENYCMKLGALDADDRNFRLAWERCLAEGMIWFTDFNEIPFEWDETPSAELANRVRDLLGLVHCNPRGSEGRFWLFALRFPGDVADLVGHYRPSIVDGMDHKRFMASSAPSYPAQGKWGRTADLSHIALADRSLDGVPERIANQIGGDDLNGRPIEFTLLGELTEPSASCDRAFTERLQGFCSSLPRACARR